MKRSTIAAATVLLLLCLCCSLALAGGSTTSIFGGRRMGMLTNLGAPDDPTALFHNPAGLGDQRGTQIFAFVSPAFLKTGFRMQELDEGLYPNVNPPGCGQPGRDACPWPVDHEGYYEVDVKPEKYFGIIPYVGATQDLGFLGKRGEDIVVSLSVYSPNFYGAFLPEDAPTAYHIIGGYFMVASATAGVGWRINDIVSVGASVSFNYMYISLEQKISLVDVLTPSGQPPNSTGQLANTMLGDLTFSFAGTDTGASWGLGALVRPLSWLSIGFAYSGSSASAFEGDLDFAVQNENVKSEEDLRKLVQVINYKLPQSMTLKMPLPHTVGMGINARLGPRIELGFDLRFWFYNVFKTQDLIPHYDESEPGNKPMTAESMSRDKDYKLSYQFSLGMMVRPFRKLMGLELMWGFGYDESPVPDHTYSLDNPNLSHLKFTAGLRWQITWAWRLSLGYLLNLYLPRDIRDSQTNPPTNVQVESLSHSPAIAITYRF